jgi:Fe-S-cluster containining protein
MAHVPNRCEGCGACCAHPSDGKWIEVTAQDALRISSEFLQEGDREPFAMKQRPNGGCVCLSDDNLCVIYESRPTICRTVERGDPICFTSLGRTGWNPKL